MMKTKSAFRYFTATRRCVTKRNNTRKFPFFVADQRNQKNPSGLGVCSKSNTKVVIIITDWLRVCVLVLRLRVACGLVWLFSALSSFPMASFAAEMFFLLRLCPTQECQV